MPETENTVASYEGAYYLTATDTHYMVFEEGGWVVNVGRTGEDTISATDVVGSLAQDGSILVRFTLDGEHYAVRASQPASQDAMVVQLLTELESDHPPILRVVDAELATQPMLKGEQIDGLLVQYLYWNGVQFV